MTDSAPLDGTAAGYLREMFRVPFASLIWFKYVLLVAIGGFGAFGMFTADDARGQILGAALMLLGFLGATAVWLGIWLLKIYNLVAERG